MSDLTKLPNIGKVISSELIKVGIDTEEKLKETGSKIAFFKIRANVDPGSCLTKLMAIESAIQGVNIKDLPDSSKKELKQYFDSIKNDMI